VARSRVECLDSAIDGDPRLSPPAGKPGLLTRVGLGTFADPRNGGGKVNDATTAGRVRVIEIDGEEYLFYMVFERLDVAFLRGTSADPSGNVSMEKEALTLEALEVAIAVHNKGGLVIVQVERLASAGSLKPRDVKIPGVLVDCVVVATTAERHTQSWGTVYNPAMSGELRQPLSEVASIALDPRKVRSPAGRRWSCAPTPWSTSGSASRRVCPRWRPRRASSTSAPR
jgi:propionate CoA-transferase